MKLIFTQYVRSLQPGIEPEAESFAILWSTLRGALASEMKKRSLWNAAPICLGVYGRSWLEGQAFDELASDCYTFIFVDRLPALQAQLKIKDNVEGLVFRNVRNFLYEARRKHDPIGFRTHAVVRQAVGRLLEAGTLHVVSGAPDLRSDSVLGWTADAGRKLEAEGVEHHVRLWCDELLPELVTARGRKLEDVVKNLAGRIARLSGEGVRGFSFRDLTDSLRDAVRPRWESLGSVWQGETALESGDGETVRRVGVTLPDTEVEDKEAFQKLCRHLTEAVEEHGGSKTTRNEMRRVWSYLRRLAADPGTDKFPSRRELCRHLGLSRHQLTAFLELVGRWVLRYQAARPAL